jgi:tetratricopeptide (TPR) repeat protein
MSSGLPDFDALWNYDKPSDTEQAFQALLPEARATGDVSYLAELLTQIARTQGLQRRFEAAHHTLNEAEELLPNSSARVGVRYELERGRVFNSSGNPDRARAFFLRAWESAVEHSEDFYAVDAAHMMGIVEPAAEQLAWNLRALDLAERSADERARNWRGSLYNNIGWTHHDAGRYEDALTMFEKTLERREAQGKPREIRIANWCIGRTLRSLGRLSEALDMQRRLLGEIEEAGDPDGYVNEELAECLLALGQDEEAGRHFARAYAVLSQDAWLVEQDAPRLQRLKELGTPAISPPGV